MSGKIMIDIHDRLGNQMFSYAFGRAMQIKQHPDYDLCLSFRLAESGGNAEEGWCNSLKFFCIPENIQTIDEIKIPLKTKMLLAVNHFSNYSKNVTNVSFQRCLNKEGVYSSYCSYYIKQWPSKKDIIYIRGRFEAHQYFDDIRDTLLREFEPKRSKTEKNKELYEIIENTESVCISIRRGDFLSETNKKIFDVCTNSYYNEAINRATELITNPTFIVFSDDIEDVKKNFTFHSNVYFEEGNDPVWEKLRLMYSCKHFIMSNSTFCWWAQYLSRNTNKIVIAPRHWRGNNENCSGLYTSDMILIDADCP